MFGEMVKQGYLLPSFLLPPSLSSFPSCLHSRTYNYEHFKEESLITLVWNHEKRHQEWVIWVFGQMGWEILNQNMWTNAMLFIESPRVTQSWLFRPLFHKVNMQPTGSHQCWHFLMLYFEEGKAFRSALMNTQLFSTSFPKRQMTFSSDRLSRSYLGLCATLGKRPVTVSPSLLTADRNPRRVETQGETNTGALYVFRGLSQLILTKYIDDGSGGLSNGWRPPVDFIKVCLFRVSCSEGVSYYFTPSARDTKGFERIVL